MPLSVFASNKILSKLDNSPGTPLDFSSCLTVASVTWRDRLRNSWMLIRSSSRFPGN
jgi:hypothetical protein